MISNNVKLSRNFSVHFLVPNKYQNMTIKLLKGQFLQKELTKENEASHRLLPPDF